MDIKHLRFEFEDENGKTTKVERVKTDNVSVSNHCDGCHFKKYKDEDKYARCPVVETGTKVCLFGYIFKEVI